MKKYALFVGINKYKIAEKFEEGSSERSQINLLGCVNDVEKVSEIFGKGFDEKKCLIDEKATKQNIINGIMNHLGLAKEGDMALFYFSGHGCQETSPIEFRKYQPIDQHENIVCYDSYSEKGIYGLADKELKVLFLELTKKRVEVIVMLDCCHSGSGIREETDDKIKHLDYEKLRGAYLEKDLNFGKDLKRENHEFIDGTFDVLTQEYLNLVFLSACKPEQLARQRIFQGEHHSVFTYSLLKVMEQTKGVISYRNIIDYIYYFIRRLDKDTNQIPQLEVAKGFNSKKKFLSEKELPIGPSKILTYDKAIERWKIGYGGIHGLIEMDGKPPTFKIFNEKNITKEICSTEIFNLGIVHSELKESNKQFTEEEINDKLTPSLNKNEIYYAVPSYLPLEKLSVLVRWSDKLMDDSSIEEKLKVLLEELLENKPNISLESSYSINWTTNENVSTLYELYVYPVKDSRSSQEKILYQIKDRETQRSLFSSHLEIENLGYVVKLLLGFAQWHRLRNLKIDNSQIDKIEQNKIILSLYDSEYDNVNYSEAITLDYFDENNLTEKKFHFKLTIENKSNFNLNFLRLKFDHSADLYEIKQKQIDSIISESSQKTIGGLKY